MTTVLLVEDDEAFAKTLALGLRSQGLDVTRRRTGESGLAAMTTDHPDVVLLDLGLPEKDGMAVISELRSWSSIPIIVISARSGEADKIDALSAGADDYVTKPFSVGELVARIRAALRRGIRPDGRMILETNGLRLDLEAKTASRAGSEIKLTATEWRLLLALIGEEGRVVSHSELLLKAWGPGATTSVEYLRVYVGALRRKLEIDASKPALILTAPGAGYSFVRGSEQP